MGTVTVRARVCCPWPSNRAHSPAKVSRRGLRGGVGAHATKGDRGTRRVGSSGSFANGAGPSLGAWAARGRVGDGLDSLLCKAKGEGKGDAEGKGGQKKGLLLSKAEVPAFIQREDFLRQLYQWAEVQLGQKGRTQFGYAMEITPILEKDVTRGFQVKIGTETTLEVVMDDEITEKYEFLARGPDGFPVPKGKRDEVVGKFLEVRKMDKNKVSEQGKQAIKGLIVDIMKAFDMYYAFGTVFADDAT
eukprot:CAMPEP_0198240818 /NCGR_PEP_ID=MMETSP1446-20131203/5819_1 /TAXON_ID=1461542 ORGANISM="Unidentified sp, Strain CCMP2111" /NCGR_SAMPLE_ID=MMETSP1446 /ASSEMBLY_ACC=CAM_ASM_001112 /LENGTH=245 /DNA_ID=CAMNT_0043923589 /DNA_START=258 /DNA_END=995 /DNA_ORIENTATION=+